MSRPPIIDVNARTGLVGLGNIPGAAPVAAFNPNLTKSLLDTKAFVAYHYRHAPNPDRHTLNEGVNVNTSVAVSRASRFYSVRQLGIVPQGIKLEDRLTVQGIFGPGSIILNVTRDYWDGDKGLVHVRPNDLIVMNDTITDMTEQLIEYNPTGPQQLHYRCKGVDYLSDAAGTIYKEGLDFGIGVDGLIYWLTGANTQRPKMVNGKGEILTVVYYYNPVYIVQNLPHNLRILPSNDAGDGRQPREAVYFPQLVIAKPSTMIDEKDRASFFDLPSYPAWQDSPNVTGGST